MYDYCVNCYVNEAIHNEKHCSKCKEQLRREKELAWKNRHIVLPDEAWNTNQALNTNQKELSKENENV